MDFDKLKENVKQLMKEKGLSQAKLAEEIGMSQPNFNKCLSLKNDSRSFTLEQVCNLADYFEVTVDELLDRPRSIKDPSVIDTCQFMAALISSNQIIRFEHTVLETIIPEPDPYAEDWHKESEKEVTYDAFYFPNYMRIPDYIDEDDPRYEEVRCDIMYGGNDMPQNITINNFLHRFIDTYIRFDSGIIKEEEFSLLEDAFFQILIKEQKNKAQLSKSATPVKEESNDSNENH